MNNFIYLDHAATTAMKKEAVQKMHPYYSEYYGNPSSAYPLSVRNKQAIAGARREIAKLINAENDEIYFTSGGTESDNWALIGIMQANLTKGKHLITTEIEHHAVLNTAKYLERLGYDVTYLKVDHEGRINLNELEKKIRNDTVLVSIMYANNEIGTLEPIKEAAALTHEAGAVFHTDAVQAVGQVPIDVKEEQIDLLSSSAHKLNGPKGIGFLYKKKEIVIEPYMHGGSQERKLRAGTENVPSIVGFGKAAEIAFEEMERKSSKERKVRDYFVDSVMREIPGTKVNGSLKYRLPNNISFCFSNVGAEELLLKLYANGIYASGGSACSTGSNQASHVLEAIGLNNTEKNGSIRFTFGEENTIQQMNYVLKVLKKAVSEIRKNTE